MATARIDKDGGWFKCAKCGHKLGRMVGVWTAYAIMPAIEVKCSSCKEINYIMIGGQNNGNKKN